MKYILPFITFINICFIKSKYIQVDDENKLFPEQYLEEIPDEFKGDLTKEEIELFESLPKTNFESFKVLNMIFNYASMIVLEKGNYELSCENCIFGLYDSKGKSLLVEKDKGKILLYKNDIIYAEFIYYGFTKYFEVSIKFLYLAYNLPFDPINMISPSEFYTSSVSYDPLKPAEIHYKKREGNYIYINSNNPELLQDCDINKALIRLDISDKEVFFTFEHNTDQMSLNTIYSGFQVRNTGNKDLEIIIKNIGFQYDGKGDFYGEKEWIDFYNLKFRLKYKDKWNERQKTQFEKIFNFNDNYEPSSFHPVTYRIPPGKYFYVIGGTTEDTYNHYNIFQTANINIKKTVVNGVVLFEVKGQAEGAYFIYDDPIIPKIDTSSYQGYVVERDNKNFGAQYIGYDNCNGVVDNSMTWEFNDLTKSQYLPVKYTVKYYKNANLKGTPYSKIPVSKYNIFSTNWTTHLNPHKFLSEYSTNETTEIRAVGEDMTRFITKNEKGERIVIDNEHYDGRGILTNNGNWMIDYIDNFNFVNRGDKDRKISVLMSHGRQGSIACFVRNANLEVIEDTVQYTLHTPESDPNLPSNDAIRDMFNYTFIVPSHSVIQIYVEYNNLANSYGNITHKIFLSDSIDNYMKLLTPSILLYIVILLMI